MAISYVRIQNYYDNRITEKCNSVSEFVKIIDNNKNSDYSILEQLESDTVRFFMDVENVPEDKPDMIIDIINDFVKFYDIPINYAYTFNNKSYHPGLSYHVYFPFKVSKAKNADVTIYKLVQTFLCKHPKYYPYIDTSVYTKNRLFRVIGSCDPGQNATRPRNKKSFHTLVKGKVEDTIIQNYNDLPDFPKQTMNVNSYLDSDEYKKFRYSKTNIDRFSLGNNLQKIIIANQKQLQQIIDLYSSTAKNKQNNLFFDIVVMCCFAFVIFYLFANR